MIPILCVKISRGLPLSRAEAAVWEEFRRRHSDEEVVSTIASVLAKHMPEYAELLKGAIQSAAVPVHHPSLQQRAARSSLPDDPG